jgi:cellulose synthase/poly-beta-1,6-N-acetylglucosamine synthase-like glycosyltransferase
MIVPAYNEEVTIVDAGSLTYALRLSRFEVIVVNDGSGDRTLERLREAFRLRRTDVPYREAIGTARVRGTYEATVPLPASVTRVVVIDKENGGKADALNAGINASAAPYFVSLDADSMLDRRALKELMRVIQEDPRVVAVGGQVAIANGCAIRNSRVVSVGIPLRSLARFQMVEYFRSFTTGRTGLDRVDSILILSGVFAVFEKETVIRAGGYLTPFVRHRITREYVGERVGTVCEDMEIVVRLQRSGQAAGPADHLPAAPGGLTEVPRPRLAAEAARRWYGACAMPRYHRAKLTPKVRAIGWLRPGFWVRALGPQELAGYVLVLFLWLWSTCWDTGSSTATTSGASCWPRWGTGSW